MKKIDGVLKDVTEADLRLLKKSPERFWHGVTSIGDVAFEGCSSLTDISIPDSVTSIGYGAFAECSSLTTISIPDSVTSIEDGAFAECSSLPTITIPDSVTSIGNDAFEGCSSLTDITIQDSVTSIGEEAFYNCRSLTDISIPDSVTSIGDFAFYGCSSLPNITIPDSVPRIGDYAFYGCSSLPNITIPDSVTSIGDRAFYGCSSLTNIKIPKTVKSVDLTKLGNQFHIMYLHEDGSVTLSDSTNEKMNNIIKQFNLSELPLNFRKWNYRTNFAMMHQLRKTGQARFNPPDYVLYTFPGGHIDSFFKNNNNIRWGKMVKSLGLDTLPNPQEKENSLADLMKIYYAIGGFSSNQGESELACEYIMNYVAKGNTPKEIGDRIHGKFSRLTLDGPYNPDFAKFFMRYYKDNPDFMVFEDVTEETTDKFDYICQAHNNFNAIQKYFPNRVVEGNTERDLLSPLFVAKHCAVIEYENIHDGNDSLALIVGKYGYSQEQFDHIQDVYDRAKQIKDQYVIMADKANEDDTVTYRILSKDDPLGFVLGDITNCCQHIGGEAESCVDDGYLNPNAGFLVFEESIKDADGKDTGKKRILGQAYVWYDKKTKTVCYDNIEIPTKVLKELHSGDKNGRGISTSALMKAVENSAAAIMRKMNASGHAVDRVTTGAGYNDLKKELAKKYPAESNPIAQPPTSINYSDAKETQYIIAEYDRATSQCARNILKSANSIIADLKEFDMSANREIKQS